MRSTPFSTVLLALGLAPGAQAGNVHLVAPSGAPFTSIQAAVDAAASGDTILVKAGQYPAFGVGNKSLAIVGDTGQLVRCVGTSTLNGLGAARTLVLENLELAGSAAAIVALDLGSCAGHVRLWNCTLAGWSDSGCANTSLEAHALRAQASADVVLAGCTLAGGASPAGMFSWNSSAGCGVRASGSSLALFDCLVRGGEGTDTNSATCVNGGLGADALRASTSFFFASGTSFQGGSGGAAGNTGVQFNCSYGGDGGDGLDLGATPLARLLDCTSAAGAGGAAGGPGCSFAGAAGLAQRGPAGVLAGTARRFSVPSPVRESTHVPLFWSGVPGDRVGLLVSASPRFEFLEGWHGVRAQAPLPQGLLLAFGEIPASGVWTVQVDLDLPPGVQSQVLHVQGLFVDGQGQKHLGTPVPLVLLDSAF